MTKLTYTIATNNGSLKDRTTGEILSTANWKVAKTWASMFRGKIVPHYIKVTPPAPATI